jgi:hypothetical protein
MDETYRMLGREHEADLERDAAKWRRGSAVRRSRRDFGDVPSLGRIPKLKVVARRAVAPLARMAVR